MENFLEALNKFPDFPIAYDGYFMESTISEALNAYNLHARSGECKPVSAPCAPSH